MGNGGVCSPDLASGLYQFSAPGQFDAYEDEMLEDAIDSSRGEAQGSAKNVHANRAHASAHKLLRTLVGDGGANKRLLGLADEVAGQCEVCQAFDRAPHLPVAGTSSASSFNKRLHVGVLFLEDVAALCAMEVYSKLSSLVRVCSRNPLEV